MKYVGKQETIRLLICHTCWLVDPELVFNRNKQR